MTLRINIMRVSILVAIILVLAGITYTQISRHTMENHQQALTLAKNTDMLFAMAMVLKILGILALLCKYSG